MRHPENRSMTGVMAFILACWVSVAAAQDNPGDPSSSALGASPGASGAVSFGSAPAGSQPVIPVGPGPSYPRVPRGITHPPESFEAAPSVSAPEALPPLPEVRLPVAGQLGFEPDGEGEPAAYAAGLTIDQAIDRVVRLNLELQAQAREISKARADVLTAGLRANPFIYADASHVPYGSFRGTSGGPTQYDLNITHPIDLNQKRQHRTKAALMAQKVTEAQYQNAVRLQIDYLYTAWVDVLAARETIRLLRAGLKNLNDQKQVVESLVQRGAASPSEVNNVEIQFDSSDLMLLEAQETHDDAKRTLAALLNLPLAEAETFEVRGSLRGANLVAPPVESLIRTGLALRPDLASFRLGIVRAQSEVRLAQANRLDDVFLVYQPFSIQQRLLPGEQPATSWAIGLTVPLPIYNRNQGNIAKAAQTVSQTETQLANLERQVILEIQRAEAAYEVTLATIQRLETEILPAARENLTLSLNRSRPDQPDPIAIIEAQRAFGDISRQYLEALIRHRRSMFRLNTAVGYRIFP